MNIKEKINNYLKRSPMKIASDAFFWLLIIMLIIPTTRAGFLSVVSKVRTAVFMPAIKANDGPVLDAAAKEWSLVDIGGKHIKLGDFDGQVLLVNFWATWCPPCRAEMPSLEKLYADYGSKITFMMVTNEEIDPISSFMDDKQYTFPVWLTLSPPPSGMLTKSIPATFIVNKQGKIVFSKTGAMDWNSKKVRDFLDTLIAE